MVKFKSVLIVQLTLATCTGNGTIGVHLSIIRRENMLKINHLL